MRDSGRGEKKRAKEKKKRERTCPSTVRSISRSSNSHCSLLPICFYFQELRQTMVLVRPSGAHEKSRHSRWKSGEKASERSARKPRTRTLINTTTAFAIFCLIEENGSILRSSVELKFYLDMLVVESKYENSCVWNVKVDTIHYLTIWMVQVILYKHGQCIMACL